MNVPDLFRLDGQVALITGGSRGLGLQMAKALGAMGCRVAITARKADELAQARSELQAIAKAAAINFTRALASEWGRYNINVNALCPGFFPSKMSAGLLETIGEQVIARAPLRRLGGDEDLMGPVVFLASVASRHITGQVLAVDGGTSAL